MPQLIYEDPDNGQEVVIEIGPELPDVTVGRNPGNIMRVNNPSISRRHTRVVWDAGQVTVYDLNSSNGTYVNGARIQSQVVVSGDRIRVGEFPIEFLDEPGAHGHGQAAMAQIPIELDESLVPADLDLDMAPVYGGHARGAGNYGAPAPAYHPSMLDSPADESGIILDGADVEELIEPMASFGARHEEYEPYAPNARGASEDMVESLASFSFPQPARAPIPAPRGNLRPLGGDLPAAPLPQAHAPASLSAHQGPSNAQLEEMRRENEELRAQIQELHNVQERQASDADDSSRAQLERLRKERDRLADERRNLMRQLNEVKRKLEEAPDPEVVEDLRRNLDAERTHTTDLTQALEEARHYGEERDVQLDGVSQDNERLQQLLADLEEQLAQSQESRQSADADMQRLSQQVSELSEQLDEVRQQTAETEEILTAQADELTQVRQAYEEISASSDQSQTRIASLESELQQALEAVAERDTYIDTVADQLEQLQAERDQLAAQSNSLAEELEGRPSVEALEEAHQEIADVRHQLALAEGERDALRAAAQTQDTRVQEQRELLYDLQSRYDKLGIDREEYKRERDALKQEKIAYARETDYLQVERRKLADQNAELLEKVAAFEKDKKRKKQIFEDLGEDLRKLVAEGQSLRTENARLQAALDAAPRGEELGQAREEVEGLRLDLQDMRANASELESDVTRLTRELGQLSERLELVSDELATCKRQLEAAELAHGSLATLVRERDSLLGRVEELEHKLAQSRPASDVARLEEEREAMQERLLAAEAAATAVPAASPQDATVIDRLRREKSDLESALAELIRENDQLKDALSQRES